jgi:hypothetical protein
MPDLQNKTNGESPSLSQTMVKAKQQKYSPFLHQPEYMQIKQNHPIYSIPL